MTIMQWGSHTNRLEKGTKLFTSRNTHSKQRVNSYSCFGFANFALQIRHVPSIYFNRSHMCAVDGGTYRSGSKVLSSCHPPTHICGFISHRQMKNKHAAGIVGSRGALTKPTRKKKRIGVWRFCTGCLRITEGKIPNSLSMRHFAKVFGWNIMEGTSETPLPENEAQHSWLIKIAIHSVSEQMLVWVPGSWLPKYDNPSHSTRLEF